MKPTEQDIRLNRWLATYGLTPARYRTASGCLFPLQGKRCKDSARPAFCSGCLGFGIADHGRYFRQEGTDLRLFVGQPYNPLQAADEAMLDEARALRLYVHQGELGTGWWNSTTFPVVISNHPIPRHGYRYVEAQ